MLKINNVEITSDNKAAEVAVRHILQDLPDVSIEDLKMIEGAIHDIREASRITQNGIKRPHASSTCGQVWALADALSLEQGSPIGRQTFIDKAVAEGYDINTARAQHSYWKKFHGHEIARERIVKSAPVEQRKANHKNYKGPFRRANETQKTTPAKGRARKAG